MVPKAWVVGHNKIDEKINATGSFARWQEAISYFYKDLVDFAIKVDELNEVFFGTSDSFMSLAYNVLTALDLGENSIDSELTVEILDKNGNLLFFWVMTAEHYLNTKKMHDIQLSDLGTWGSYFGDKSIADINPPKPSKKETDDG